MNTLTKNYFTQNFLLENLLDEKSELRYYSTQIFDTFLLCNFLLKVVPHAIFFTPTGSFQNPLIELT